ncbi:hypothetical protein Bbelb_179130 [Branchiostoma belcheri]|nr:hypothetical protein Bbelb_179130 [Branchiostoma belcheri]
MHLGFSIAGGSIGRLAWLFPGPGADLLLVSMETAFVGRAIGDAISPKVSGCSSGNAGFYYWSVLIILVSMKLSVAVAGKITKRWIIWLQMQDVFNRRSVTIV